LAILAENLWPFQQGLFSSKHQRAKHIATNLLFLLLSTVINSLFAVVFILAAQHNQLGLFNYIDLPWYLSLPLALLAFDFVAQYLCHIALHKLPWLWQLHIVHHNDFHVDVSTGSRHHPIDYCTRELAALSCFILLGAPISYYLIYKLLSIFFTYFTHANLQLTKRLDKVLSIIFITPSIHKVHHHQYLPFTDSNYGNIFSFWDRLFGTLKSLENNKLEYGLDTDLKEKELQLGYQLIRPFLAKKQRLLK
jgi:sterol desaturase/sphingolipid hydroxylase (fatty acid hydroxylase superfamily)